MRDEALYDITLRIGYDYDHPAGSNRTMLRMQPLGRIGQQMVSGYVGADPRPGFRRDGFDFFGNPVTEVAFDRPLTQTEFRFSGRVRVGAVDSGLDLSGGLEDLAAELSVVQGIDPGSPHHFLGASPRIAPSREFSEFARDILAGASLSVRDSAMAICDAVHREFTFDPTATDVTTTPLEAFRNRRGVCQDISHVAIAALRATGIPAAYVSGFLRTIPPPGAPRLQGADAMHAWVRIWCGADLDWVEIDPTNAALVGTDHIAVAIGRDYADVAPVKGSMRSVGSHRTFQQVDVVPVGGRG